MAALQKLSVVNRWRPAQTNQIENAQTIRRLNEYIYNKGNIMKKHLLKEQYRRLFKGRAATNDSKLLSENFMDDMHDVVSRIAREAEDEEDMTDDIVDELGDFYDDVQDSGNNKLIDAYDALRNTTDEGPEAQAEAARALLDLL